MSPFPRSEEIKDAQVISYSVDSSAKWCALSAISSPDRGTTINGLIQLYSIDAQVHQSISGFAPSFADLPLIEPGYKNSVIVFVKKPNTEAPMQVLVLEVGKPIDPKQKIAKSQPFQPAPEVTTTDFPLMSYVSEKNALVFILSKLGYLYVHELYTGAMIHRVRVSTSLVAALCKHTVTDGMLCVNAKGSVLLVSVDQNSLVNYIRTQCPQLSDPTGIAFKLAKFNSLPGAQQLFEDQFNKYLAMADYTNAAKTAVAAPEGALRNSETLQKFKTSPTAPGARAPLLQYFSYLLDANVKLNAEEAVELVRPALLSGRQDMVEGWVKADKLECTSQLGDMVKAYNPQLAVSIYSKSGSSEQTVQSLAETGQFDQIVPYCKRVGYQPNFQTILKKILDSGLQDKAVEFAKMICSRGDGGRGQPAVPLPVVVELFLQYHRVSELCSVMMDVLECNRPEDAALQTKLLELSASCGASLTISILQKRQLTYYDKQKVAKLCEQLGLFDYALENFTDIADIRRIIVNTHMLNQEHLLSFICTLEPANAKVCLQDLIKVSSHNILLATEAGFRLSEAGTLPQADVVTAFESLGSVDGCFFYLGKILPTTTDKELHFKYIAAATKLNKLSEVERVIRDTKNYDAAKVKDFLVEQKLPDPKALVFLCDIYGFVEEMTKYLYKNGFWKHIEMYLLSFNQQAAPKVMAALLEMECEEASIKTLLAKVRGCAFDKLIEAFETRGRLRMLQGWLEARTAEGNQSTEVHTALAKIYVDINRDADNFLANNAFYDPKIVGKYCEDREPLKACIAYKRAAGKCDRELIEVTNKNMLHKLQASYLVERKDPELWKLVLSDDNTHRPKLVEHVAHAALAETKNTDEVSVTVKAFADAGLHAELIEILDKIVLHRSEFAQYSHLQSLLILTAIKVEPTRVMDYVNRLDNYNAPKLAQKALEHKLYEEALAIYTKFGNHDEAMEVLLTKLEDLPRAAAFADKIDQPATWTKMGQAYLERGQVTEAIACFLKSQDARSYMLVIGTAERQGKYDHLIDYLVMARQKLKDAQIDSALIYAFAKCGRLSDIETFLSQPNSANVEQVGTRCYDDKLFDAGRILFTQIGKLGKLASCLVNLGQYQAALEAAKKADSPTTWEEVCFSCVRAKEFRMAAVAGQKVIVHPDRVEILIETYESLGYWEELIKLIDSSLTIEQVHNGIFTELGVLLAKYIPTRLMDHLRTYFQRLHIIKVLRACEGYQMWKEAVFLHAHYGQSDSAVAIMIEHSPTAWEHDVFVQNMQKVTNSELYYRAITFYLAEQPMLINELLIAIAPKLDLTKTVSVLKPALALVEKFLRNVQSNNVPAVNEALNELYLEAEDYESLRASVSDHDKFDQLGLAKRLEKHPLFEFRRIAALLYKKNKKYPESIAISKADEQYKVYQRFISRTRSKPPWKARVPNSPKPSSGTL